MDFVVYARRSEKSDSSENTRSGDLSAADKQ